MKNLKNVKTATVKEVKKENSYNAMRKEQKNEFYSLNQAIKVFNSFLAIKDSKTVAHLAKKGYKNEYYLTVEFIKNNWHSIKIDGQLAYRYVSKGLETRKVKVKFTTNDISLCLSKAIKNGVKLPTLLDHKNLLKAAKAKKIASKKAAKK